MTIDYATAMGDGAKSNACIDRLGRAVQGKVIGVTWKHQGSTISAIQSQRQSVFALSLKFVTLCVHDPAVKNSILNAIATRLLELSWHTKGKYLPLKSLLDFVSASELLKLTPGMFDGVFSGMLTQPVHSVAQDFFSAFLKAFVKEQAGEKDSSERVQKLVESLIASLLFRASKNETLWKTLLDDVFQGIMAAVPNVFVTLLRAIEATCKAPERKQDTQNMRHIGGSESIHLLLLLSAINFAKKSRLVLTEDALAKTVEECTGTTLQNLLQQGIMHPEEMIFAEALEIACLASKQSDIPTPLDTEIVKVFISSNPAHSSINSRQRMTSPLSKFFERVKCAITKSSKPATQSSKKTKDGDEKTKENEGTSSPVKKQQCTAASKTANEMKDFVNWVVDECIAQLYPSAPQERILFALALLSMVCSIFKTGVSGPLLSAVHVDVLLSCLWHTIDKARIMAHQILIGAVAGNNARMDSFDAPDTLRRTIEWGIKLAHTPRMHQSDAGGRVISFVMSRLLGLPHYVVKMNVVTVETNNAKRQLPFRVEVDVKVDESINRGKAEIALDFMNQLLVIEKANVGVLSANPLLASQRSPAHGILSALRACLESLPKGFVSATVNENPALRAQWKQLVADLFGAVDSVIRCVLPIVGDLAPEGYDPLSKGVESGSTSLIQAQPAEHEQIMCPFGDDDDAEGGDDDIDDDGECVDDGDEPGSEEEGGVVKCRAKGQIIIVCSWLCVKQASFLMAEIHDVMPFPAEGREEADAENILTLGQIEWTGSRFLELLLSTRHKGAIEKGYEGFRSVCTRILRCKVPRIVALTGKWVDAILAGLDSPSAKQVTRRSAGIPFALLGVLNGDLSGIATPTDLLERTMQCILDLSAGSHGDHAQVHAFNIVGNLVNKKALSAKVDNYLDKILVRILEAYTHHDWSVRNAASIAFNLVVKRRVSTASFSEFFARFPVLYQYLLEHIDALVHNQSDDLLQTSLFAVLTLLSRLQPSAYIATAAETSASGEGEQMVKIMDPEAFITPLRACAHQRTFRIREAAAFALVPIVHPSHIEAVCLDIAKALPVNSSVKPFNCNSVHGDLLQLEKLILCLVQNSNNNNSTISKELLDELSKRTWLMATGCAAIGLVAARSFNALVQQPKLVAPDSEFTQSVVCTARVTVHMMLTGMLCPNPRELAPMESLRGEMVSSLCTEFALREPKHYSDAIGETAYDLVSLLLTHTPCELYEMREACLKQLKRAVKKDISGTACFGPRGKELPGLLSTLLCVNEQYTFCQLLLLKTFVRLPEAMLAESKDEKIFDSLWIRCVELYKDDRLRTACVTLLAFLLEHWPGVEKRREHVIVLLDYLEKCSDSSRVVSERSVVAPCIGRVLGASNPVSERESVQRMWILLLRMLQDDDCFVRQDAGVVVSRLLHIPMPLSPPVALEHAHRMLVSVSGSIVSLVQPFSPDKMAVSSSGEKEQPTMLFESEPDNAYMEDAVLLQLEARNRRMIKGDKNNGPEGSLVKASDVIILVQHATQAIKTAVTTAEHRRTGQQRWITYDPRYFMLLYRALLAMVQYQQLLNDTDYQALKSLPIHPLLAQMLQRLHPEPHTSELASIDASSFLLTTSPSQQ